MNGSQGNAVDRSTEHPDARWAAELEADADLYPDERGELLLEAAAAWRRAGDADRAQALWRALIAAGSQDAQFARVEVAESLLDVGNADAAYAELAALRAARPLQVGPCQMAAELLEEFGHLDDALSWFNVATTRLGDDELAQVGADGALFSYAGHVLIGRRRVREALGLPEDALDAATPVPPRLGGPHPFPTATELLDDLADSPVPGVVMRSLFWQRAEVPQVCARWPETFGADGDGDYHRRLEANFRKLAGRGVQRIELVPGSADGLDDFAAQHGSAAETSETRRAYMEDLHGRGCHIAWPPARNGPCWCGSGAKYKKCCGNPVHQSAP